MDFGTLKNTFTEILIESHVKGDKKGKNLYKKFLKTLKENETLKTYFIAYKNLEGKTVNSEDEANQYINEHISILQNYRGDKSLNNQSTKLIKLLEGNGYKVTQKPTELHKALNTLISTKKDVTTIDTLLESTNVIKKHLLTPKTTVKESTEKTTVDPNKFLNLVVDKYNDKYSSLSEEDKKIVKTILSNNKEEQESLLNTLKKESTELLNKLIKEYNFNTEVKVKLYESKDMIQETVFNEKTFKEDIIKIYDLMKNLS